MKELVYLRLPQGMLERLGLPDHPYPVPLGSVPLEVGAQGELSLGLLLFGLQLASEAAGKDWERFEPAMDRLAALIAPESDEGVCVVARETWWLEIGPVDLTGRLVTIQRGNRLIAAIAGRADGRLRAVVYRPLDAKSAASLIGLSLNPHPDSGVCMYARDTVSGYDPDPRQRSAASLSVPRASTQRSLLAVVSFFQKGARVFR